MLNNIIDRTIAIGVLIVALTISGVLIAQERRQYRINTIEKQVNLIADCLNDAQRRDPKLLTKDWAGCLEY